MNKINRKVEYALVALKHMSQKRPGELSTVKEICQLYSCPFDATSRVMQSLAQKQILKSEQGAYGGYQIQRDLKKVSLYDLIEVTVGPIEIAKCMGTDALRPNEDSGKCDMAGQCNILQPVRLLNDRLIQFYRSINVWDLIISEERGDSRDQQTLLSAHPIKLQESSPWK